MIGVKGAANVPAWEPELTWQGTGSTVPGGVYAIDVNRASANSTDYNTGMANVMPVDATNSNGARLVIAKNAVAQYATVQTIGKGIGSCIVSGAAQYGSFLKPVSGQNYLVAVTGPTNIAAFAVAQLLDTTATAGVTQLCNVDFWGRALPSS